MTVATGELREIDRTDNGDITGLAFAPDSRWLAWSHPGPQPLAQIRVAEVADPAATPIDVTPLRFADTEPAFSTDGNYLAFLSTRSFDPIYDAYVFDLSFPNGCRPQLVTLSATTPSPFDPDVAGRAPAPPKDAPPAEFGAADVPVDAEGIDQRVVPFPVPAARYASLRAVAGGFAWLRAPLAGALGDDLARLDDDPPRPALERFDLDVAADRDAARGRRPVRARPATGTASSSSTSTRCGSSRPTARSSPRRRRSPTTSSPSTSAACA